MAHRLPLLLLMVSQDAWAGLFCTEEKPLDAIHLGAHCIASSGLVGMQCNNAWDGDPSTIWHPATRGVQSYTSISYPTNVVISKVRILQHHWSMGWADGVNIFINGDKINAKLQHRGLTLNWDQIILEQSYHTALMSVMISSVKDHAFGGIREIQVFGCLPEDALGKLDDWKSLGHIVSLGDILHSKPGDLVPGVSQPTLEDNYEALMNGGHLGIVDEALVNGAGGHLEIVDEQKQDSTTQTVVIQEEITTERVTSVQTTVKEVETEDTFYDPDDIFGFQEDSSLVEKVYSIGLDDSQSLHDYSGLEEERVSLSSLPTAMAGVLAVVILVVLAGVAGYWYRAGHRYSMSLSVSSEDRDRYLVQEDDLSYFSDSTLRATPPMADSRSSRVDSRATPPRFLADSRSVPVSFLTVSRSAPPSCMGGKTREEGSLLDETKC